MTATDFEARARELVPDCMRCDRAIARGEPPNYRCAFCFHRSEAVAAALRETAQEHYVKGHDAGWDAAIEAAIEAVTDPKWRFPQESQAAIRIRALKVVGKP